MSAIETGQANPPRASVPRWLVPAVVASAAFVVLMAPFWAPTLLARMDFFRVRHVEVVGARYIAGRTTSSRICAWIPWRPCGTPTEPLRARVAAHPLVRDVDVGRKLPGTLVVRVREHEPVALVPTANGFRAYDERGVQLPIDPATADVDAPILARPRHARCSGCSARRAVETRRCMVA